MSFERPGSVNHPGWPARLGPLTVAAGEVRLRPVRMRDAAAWSRARISDEKYLRPWEPTGVGPWDARHHVSAWPGMCVSLRAAARRGLMLPMVIELDRRFSGQLTIGNIVRGPLRSAWIGYWVASSVKDGGVATAAVALAVDHCFAVAGLHRLEATVRPENLASQSVLRKVGFREEGLLRDYMDVDGAWRDHILVAMTVEDHVESATARLVQAGRASWNAPQSSRS
ncbi:GNAT family N-acetyltransferase [Speluncibacter jeojiensis]|uniref:GNAT family N-acetyltransferase n=1 Tax=Speluncibacter jeojiensis TaxID=2710754 RepID=A0A9X4RDG5_9ACTN|nr:GNAT family protein [Rhodococcus sp. D2-41]MDG3014795.1 GNAT family N-acetyltransferase [Corynebacteriales bacterium D3-21]